MTSSPEPEILASSDATDRGAPAAPSDTPQRVRLRRTKGWRKPEGAIVVSRPSRWGNPFRIGSTLPTLFVHDGRRVWAEVPRSHQALPEARQIAVDLFALHIGPMGNYEYDDETVALLRSRLAGHDLACWCPLDQPCHADVLLEIANAVTSGDAVRAERRSGNELV